MHLHVKTIGPSADRPTLSGALTSRHSLHKATRPSLRNDTLLPTGYDILRVIVSTPLSSLKNHGLSSSQNDTPPSFHAEKWSSGLGESLSTIAMVQNVIPY